MSISLVIKCGDNKAKVLMKPKLTFGRSKSSVDISIDDTKISSKHLEITYENKKIIVRDLGSTNGTYVNNKKITEHQLFIYETVQIGNCLITISLDDLTAIEQKSLTRPIDPNDPGEDLTSTSTVLADKTGFLALNDLSLEQRALRGENRPRPNSRPKKTEMKKKSKKEEEKTVMTKLFNILKK